MSGPLFGPVFFHDFWLRNRGLLFWNALRCIYSTVSAIYAQKFPLMGSHSAGLFTEEQKKSRAQVKHWRTRQGVVQLKVASPTSEAGPIAVDPECEEVLRDV